MKTLKDIRNGLLSEERDETTEKVEMAETQLHFICYAAKEIIEYIQMGGEIEEWYQNKLSKVHSDVESLHSYVEGEKRRTGMVAEEVEQVDESYNWDKLVRKHLKDARNSNNTRKQRKYAESMASRALEASKIADPEKAYRHYMGVGAGDNVEEEVEQVEEGVVDKIKQTASDVLSPGRRQKWADSKRKRGLHTAIKQTRDGRVMSKNQEGKARSFGQSEKDLARRYTETGHKPFWWKMKEEVEQVEEGRKLMSLKPPSAAKRLKDFTKPVSQIPAPKGGHSLSDDEERVWDPIRAGYVVRKKK